MPTDTPLPVGQKETIAHLVIPSASSTLFSVYSLDDDTYASTDIALAPFKVPTGNLVYPIYVHSGAEIELRLLSAAARATLASGKFLKLIEDVSVGVGAIGSHIISSLARGSELMTWRLQTELARALQPQESFEEGAERLVEHLRGFGDITSEWPEFSEAGFPQSSVDRAVDFLRNVWIRVGQQGQAAVANAFCGPSEDGAVNCQWKRPDRFLGLTIPADGPCEVYFVDDTTDEEFEGDVDVEQFALWIQRF